MRSRDPSLPEVAFVLFSLTSSSKIGLPWRRQGASGCVARGVRRSGRRSVAGGQQARASTRRACVRAGRSGAGRSGRAHQQRNAMPGPFLFKTCDLKRKQTNLALQPNTRFLAFFLTTKKGYMRTNEASAWPRALSVSYALHSLGLALGNSRGATHLTHVKNQTLSSPPSPPNTHAHERACSPPPSRSPASSSYHQ